MNFCLVLLCGCALSEAETGRSPSIPAPVQEPYWIREFAGQQRLLNRKVDWCFVGDSLTAQWKTTGQRVLAREFKDKAIANLGIAADRTENVLFRIQRLNFSRARPEKVVVLIGTNNLAKNNSDSPADTAAGIEAIVKELVQRCPGARIVLLKIFPNGYQNDSPLRRVIQETNGILDLLKEIEEVQVCDFTSLFFNADGLWKPGMTIDGTHLSEAGYDQFGRALRKVLDETNR